MSEWHVQIDGIDRKVELYLPLAIQAAVNDDHDHEAIFISDEKDLDDLIFTFGYDGKLLLSWRGYFRDAVAGSGSKVQEGIKFVHYNHPSVHFPTAVEFDPENPSHLERRLVAYKTARALEFSIRLADSDSELLVPFRMILEYGREHGLLPAANGARQG